MHCTRSPAFSFSLLKWCVFFSNDGGRNDVKKAEAASLSYANLLGYLYFKLFEVLAKVVGRHGVRHFGVFENIQAKTLGDANGPPDSVALIARIQKQVDKSGFSARK